MITNAESIQALQTAAEQWAETLNWPNDLTVKIGEAKATFAYGHEPNSLEAMKGMLTIQIPVTGTIK